MSIEPERQDASRSDLADALRELRRAAGLSGERLAVRCAMSQSKISRIESGRTLPTVVDVERILRALEVPKQVEVELVGLARRANIDYMSWRTYARIGLWQKQADLRALEESATVMRHFLPAIPTGLLHVRDYAAHTLSPSVNSEPARDVERVLRARLERQAVLDDPSRRFSFLLTEQAVRWRMAGRDVMVEQVLHLAEVASMPSVEIAIIPESAEVNDAPLHVFVVYDDRLVTIELFSGEVALRDPQDVLYYLELFEFFLAHALTGDDAISFLRGVAREFM